MGFRPMLITFTSAEARLIAAKNNISHVELNIRSVSRALIPLYRTLRTHASSDDIVVAVQPYSSYWFLVLSFVFSSLKWVISFRNHPDELLLGAGINGRVIYRWLPILLKSVDAVTSNSIETIEDLKKIQKTARYFYVRNSVKTRDDISREIWPDKPRLIFVGRLCDQKSPFLALKIVESLAKQLPITLDLYGDGDLRSELESYVEQRKLPVFLHGHKKITPTLLSRHDLLLVTSKYEGFPNVILEAGSVALPVASVHFRSGATEVLLPDRGFLISTDAIQAANEIEFRLREASDLRLMGIRLFDYVRKSHSDSMQACDLEILIDAL